MREAILWLVGIEAIGLAAMPLALRVLFALPDRGFAASKMLGLLVVAYVVWSTSMVGLTAFTGPTIVVVTLALGIGCWWRWGAAMRSAWSEARPLAIGAEVTFLLAYAVAVAVRAHNAPIAGQEKPMDFTFLHSLIRAPALPAEDLWLAGHGMPYYYFGYLLQSLVAKVMPIEPAVAYNLAVASVLALAACGAFGVVASLSRVGGATTRMAAIAGGSAAFALVAMGNLQALCEWLASHGIGDAAFWSGIGVKQVSPPGVGFPPPDGAWWFRAARVIPNIQPDGITEFPYFSFLLGDLHPHYMAIPLAMLVAALATHDVAMRAPLSSDRMRLGVMAVVLGAVIPSNTWDVPVLWGLVVLALLAGALPRDRLSGAAVAARLRDVGLLVGLAVVLYAPYFVGYVSQPLRFGLVSERTPFGSLVVLFGPLILLAFGGGLIGVIAAQLGRSGLPEARALVWLVVAGLVGGMVGVGLREPTLGFLVATLALWLALGWHRARLGTSIAGVGTALLVVIGTGSILVPELVYLHDLFGSRMNTVFKFYYDAWIFLALSAPLIGMELFATVRAAIHHGQGALPTASARALAAAAAGCLSLAVALALGGVLYPVAATQTKSAPFAGRPTLDGMAHLRAGRPDDVGAIEWLRSAKVNAPVVEAVGDDYTDAGRISTFAGVPTLVGWIGHEIQWRGQNPEIERRKQLARGVYTEGDEGAWRDALEELGARYIVVGTMEREVYGPTAGAALANRLFRVHQSGGTVIYALRPPQVALGAR